MPLISEVTERLQLGLADACLMSMVHPESGEQAEVAAQSALQLAGIWSFPMDLINTRGQGVGPKGTKGRSQGDNG